MGNKVQHKTMRMTINPFPATPATIVPFNILLCLTPDDFTCQGKSSCREKVKLQLVEHDNYCGVSSIQVKSKHTAVIVLSAYGAVPNNQPFFSLNNCSDKISNHFSIWSPKMKFAGRLPLFLTLCLTLYRQGFPHWHVKSNLNLSFVQ